MYGSKRRTTRLRWWRGGDDRILPRRPQRGRRRRRTDFRYGTRGYGLCSQPLGWEVERVLGRRYGLHPRARGHGRGERGGGPDRLQPRTERRRHGDQYRLGRRARRHHADNCSSTEATPILGVGSPRELSLGKSSLLSRAAPGDVVPYDLFVRNMGQGRTADDLLRSAAIDHRAASRADDRGLSRGRARPPATAPPPRPQTLEYPGDRGRWPTGAQDHRFREGQSPRPTLPAPATPASAGSPRP